MDGCIWIRRTCDYIQLNVYYFVLFSSREGVRISGLDLVLVGKLLCTRICATLGCNCNTAQSLRGRVTMTTEGCKNGSTALSRVNFPGYVRDYN